MKTAIRKELDKELRDKLLLKDASLWRISIHLWGRVWAVVSKVYKSHTTLVWEFMAGAGWALFIARYWGIL